MGKDSNRPIDEIEREIMMTAESNRGSKDATSEKAKSQSNAEQAMRHERGTR